MPDTSQGVNREAGLPDGYAGATPLMRQYFSTRSENPGILLLMRVGDFFEAYGDDAVTIAELLEITLTGREDGGTRVPMAGVPHHAVERYVARLITRGHRVALMDQVEDARLAKGLVKRRVTRIVTPGTVLEDAMLDASSNNYLVAAVVGDPVCGIGVADVSTGEFLTTEIGGDIRQARLVDEIVRLSPSELLLPESVDPEFEDAVRSATHATIVHVPDVPAHAARARLLVQFGTASLRGFGCEEFTTGIEACSSVLRYLDQTQAAALRHITALTTYSTSDFMVLDASTRRHLELTTSYGEAGKRGTLLHTLDYTLTPMGGRLLRRWIEEPLLHVAAIERRAAGVAAGVDNAIGRGDARDLLREIGDLERLASRVSAGLATARDLIALRDSLVRIPSLAAAVPVAGSDLMRDIVERCGRPMPVVGIITAAIVDDPPTGYREAGVIKLGHSPELDALRQVSADARSWIAALEASERERTGIGSLKVGYNAVFGYYLEVTRANVPRVPDSYIRKQTTASGERYITPELKEYEARVLGADEKAADLEVELFSRVRGLVAEHCGDVIAVGRAVAELDAALGLAEAAARNGYIRATIDDGYELAIVGGRHPVIERLAEASYIPNDCHLTPDARMSVITGPNMSGKSSYLRQVALITLMAQVGSFVPAKSAKVGLVDRIFTRVGAHDELASGQSTFMVEMVETANILNNATARSLVILDEIGRGTSTYDGLSIAWAVCEYLVAAGCKTLFATHYHYLNELATQYPEVRNFRVSVKEDGDRFLFLRRLVPGGTDKSYGVHVARMAGLPRQVVTRAAEILRTVERERAGAARALTGSEPIAVTRQRMQLTLFEAERHPILDELGRLDTDALTPMEALVKIDEWRRRLDQQAR